MSAPADAGLLAVTDADAITLAPVPSDATVAARTAGMEALRSWRLTHADSQGTGMVSGTGGISLVAA